MNNEFVSVPRELIERIERAGVWPKEVEELQALLAQPAARHQGEPVAEVVDMKYNRVHFHRATGDDSKPYLQPGTKLYTNADTGEVERLRELMREASTELDGRKAEIYTLRAQLAELLPAFEESQEKLVTSMKDAKQLESDLAERDSYIDRFEDESSRLRGAMEDVRDWIGSSQSTSALRAIVEKALSASAQPSAPKCSVCGQGAWACNEGGCHYLESGNGAPVERDERAEFEVDRLQKGFAIDRIPSGDYLIPAVRFAWEGWQARVALEHKS